MTAIPDLPEIMELGFGITEALALWSEMMNSQNVTPELWRAELKRRASERIVIESMMADIEKYGTAIRPGTALKQ